MATIGDLGSWGRELERVLSEVRSKISMDELRADTRECHQGIRANQLAHGLDPESPFFNFMLLDNVALLTIFDRDLSLYSFACDERAMIATFSDLAMTDVDRCRGILAETYGKPQPDLVLAHDLVARWLA